MEIPVNRFARMLVRMPLYVSQWMRTKYMSPSERLMPIRLPYAHKAGRIVYTSLVCNAEMKKLSPVCYSAQMFGIPVVDIPEDKLELYPSDEIRHEFVAIALYKPHYFLGRWIDDNEMWQLGASDATRFNAIMLEEFWHDLDAYWAEYRKNALIQRPDRVPIFYDALLDYCDLFGIDIDAVDSMHRAYKRLRKKQKDAAANL